MRIDYTEHSMRVTTKLRVAQVVGLATLLAAFEAFHLLNISGWAYLISVLLVIFCFYFYAGQFRCAQCQARLFTPYRLATPFFPTACKQYGHKISQN
jgi:hypothetical protein